ncbi:MAG: hypothetical protein IJ416_01910 [Ruminiclostridium sp.]|nr:hypothetical protein [Ruminiclostridium sp.]
MKKIIVLIILGILLMGGIGYGISWLPEDIEMSVSGQLTNKATGEIADETLRISGKLYTPLFSNGLFDGTVVFENNPALSATPEVRNTCVRDSGTIISLGIGMKITDCDGNGCSFSSDVVSEGETRRIIDLYLSDDGKHSVMAEVFTNPEDFQNQVNFHFST